MAFDDLTISQKNLIIRLVEKLTSDGEFSSEFWAHWWGGLVGFIDYLNNEGANEVITNDFEAADLFTLQEKGYVTLIARKTGQQGRITAKAEHHYKLMVEDRTPNMSKEEFAQQLADYKRDFIDNVISYYEAENGERGRLAFQRWKEGFVSFLKKHVPNEASRFEMATSHIGGYAVKSKESAFNGFMREDGNTCLAFLDDLTDSALKGQIQELQNIPLASEVIFARAPTAFLSYAREDIEQAERLFNDLREVGVNVWFDKHSLLPGQKWKAAIREAMKNSRFFLALLSTSSINKRGYVQKELKEALEIYDEYPESAIFLIPIRLDECIPLDERVKNLHWVDMYQGWERGLARIVRTIESQI